MAAALMSNVSSVLNSASTITTMDLYKKYREWRVMRRGATGAPASFKPGDVVSYDAGPRTGEEIVSERELVRFGRWSGVVTAGGGENQGADQSGRRRESTDADHGPVTRV